MGFPLSFFIIHLNNIFFLQILLQDKYNIGVYLSCNAKQSPKQLPNCLKRSETIVVLIVFNGVLYDISAYAVTVFSVALHESGTRKALLVKALL